jgi:hypothetical protein
MTMQAMMRVSGQGRDCKSSIRERISRAKKPGGLVRPFRDLLGPGPDHWVAPMRARTRERWS